MKAKTKAMVLAVCAVLLVVTTVFVTMAFLTSTTDVVTNTFTVGKVQITLDETDVDSYGSKDSSSRVTSNSYKLIPGHSYTKDPTVHFQPGSEASWLFVKVENGISAIEANTSSSPSIANQIAKDWTALDGVDNVYYRQVAANTGSAAVDYSVFKKFTLQSNAATESYASASIKITAYAIQADGFTTANDAWTAGNFS